jgi:hypothetical protein
MEASGVQDEPPPTLLTLPPEILDRIAQNVLPPGLWADSPWAWAPAVAFGSCCLAAHASLGASLMSCIPAFEALEPRAEHANTCWFSLLAALRAPDGGRWHSLRPLRAKRPAARGMEAMQNAPRLSGGTLCAMGGSRLVLYGGRSSETGQTLASARLVTLSFYPIPLAQWDDLRSDVCPPPRCYHTAVRWAAAERAAPAGASKMLVFGGAGESAGGVAPESDLSQNALHGDTWCLHLWPAAAAGQPSTRSPRCASWERIPPPPGAPSPAARSSHVCSVWLGGGGLPVLHGGLGNDGTMSDTWLFCSGQKNGAPDGWKEMQTCGQRVARAHHSGGVVGDSLLVFSGQDANLLTSETICALHLPTATWSVAALPSDGPASRIDASCAVIPSLGLLLFGGVGAQFEFESDVPWFVPGGAATAGRDNGLSGSACKQAHNYACSRAHSPAPSQVDDLTQGPRTAAAGRLAPLSLVSPWERAPKQRACAALAVDGLHAYVFGGFDGQQDLDDLWCLSLIPPAFADAAAGRRESRRDASAYSDGSRVTGGTFDEIGAAEFKLRRAAQVKELHSLRGASGQSYMPVHIRVWQAGAAKASPPPAGRQGRDPPPAGA